MGPPGNRCVAAALATFLLAGLLSAATAQGPEPGCDSLGFDPAPVEVPAAQAGESYLVGVALQNPCEAARSVDLTVSGDAAAWTSPLDSPLPLASHASATAQFRVRIPPEAGPGTRSGMLTFTADARAGPAGSGFGTRIAGAVPLNVTVGGERHELLVWGDASAGDTDTGHPPSAKVEVRNAGNVQVVAQVLARATLDPGSGPGGNVEASAAGNLTLEAGAEGLVQVAFRKPLPLGTYRLELRSGTSGAAARPNDLWANLTFSVTRPGEVAPHGSLRALLHAPYASTGRPVRIDGWFANTGQRPVTATLGVEVEAPDGALLAALSSPPLAVEPGKSLNLTVYWTPSGPGAYTLRGIVVFAGIQTPAVESTLNVQGSPVQHGLAWPWIAGGMAAAAAAGAGAVWWRRRGA